MTRKTSDSRRLSAVAAGRQGDAADARRRLEELLDQPMPQRLVDLVEALRNAERERAQAVKNSKDSDGPES
ncbi:MAG: hypothetical protein AAGL11_04450 [Pseudomonadota bacterium]